MDPTIFTKTLGNADRISKWNETLIKNKAILAGGGVLAPYAEYARNDLDVYVGKENLVTLCHDLGAMGAITPYGSEDGLTVIRTSIYQLCFAAGYDKSFFRKNHLLARVRVHLPRQYQVGNLINAWDNKNDMFSVYRITNIEWTESLRTSARLHLQGIYNSKIDDTPNDMIQIWESGDAWDDIDIIVVDTEKATVEDVVTNFDLSFCEIWYTGKDIRLGHTTSCRDRAKTGQATRRVCTESN